MLFEFSLMCGPITTLYWPGINCCAKPASHSMLLVPDTACRLVTGTLVPSGAVNSTSTGVNVVGLTGSENTMRIRSRPGGLGTGATGDTDSTWNVSLTTKVCWNW